MDGSFHVHDVAVTSTPAHEDGYRVGENIDVTLTFTTEAYASADSVIAMQVGDVGPSYRRAAYVSGSGTTRLTYRYEVQLTDLDADGIGIPRLRLCSRVADDQPCTRLGPGVPGTTPA